MHGAEVGFSYSVVDMLMLLRGVKMRKRETTRFLYVTDVGGSGVGRRRKSMVAVGFELQEQGGHVLVGQGDGYKMACGWFVSDITRGSSSQDSFFACYTNFFISSVKSNKD